MLHNVPENWLCDFPRPKPDGHKYDRGDALIYGGELMTGAARLAARAAQRMGAGLVTLACSAKVLPFYAATLESVIVRGVNDAAAWRILLDDPKRNAVLIGPGLGQGTMQAELVAEALKIKRSTVLDADALTMFADRPDFLFSRLHQGCVLTPHEGEFAKLFHQIDPQLPKTERALQAARLSQSVVLLKGAETVIAAPNGQAVINDNAPPWLATAGAGDVLAGLVLGLVAQKMPVFQAASAAAWIHGRMAADFGMGLIAEDLVEAIPKTIQWLMGQSSST